MVVRIVVRAVVYDPEQKRILLVKNKGGKHWYPVGGGWEPGETLLEGVCREVREEANLEIDIVRFLYLREFRLSADEVWIELYWLAHPVGDGTLSPDHTDLDPDSSIGEIRWMGEKELADLLVFPEQLKSDFWRSVNNLSDQRDPFLGTDHRTQ